MDNKIYDLMEKMYSEMQNGFKQVNSRIDTLENKVDNLKNKVDSIEKTVLKIENVHGEKFTVLFDGYAQHTQQLERIEQEVSKHEEIIKRVK